MDKIKAQANKVSQLLFSTETGAAYKKVLALTWDILRETGILLWLIVCLLFVGIEWFYLSSIKLGYQVRAWYENLGKENEAPDAEAKESTGEAILNAGQSGLNYLMSQARQQLGMKAPEPPVPPQKSEAAPPANQSASAKTPTPAAATPAPGDDSPTAVKDASKADKQEASETK